MNPALVGVLVVIVVCVAGLVIYRQEESAPPAAPRTTEEPSLFTQKIGAMIDAGQCELSPLHRGIGSTSYCIRLPNGLGRVWLTVTAKEWFNEAGCLPAPNAETDPIDIWMVSPPVKFTPKEASFLIGKIRPAILTLERKAADAARAAAEEAARRNAARIARIEQYRP